jgi:hypothetical protein
MCPGNTRQRPDSDHNEIFLTISERILRARQRALEKPAIAEKMRLAS